MKNLKKFIYETKEQKALIQATHNKKKRDKNLEKELLEKIKIHNLNLSKRKNVKEIIIIENKECFLRYEEFLNENYFENLLNFKECLIFNGNGDNVISKKSIKYLKDFDVIHCFFDYDLASLNAFERLKHNNKIFYLPKKEIMKNIIELIYYHQQKRNIDIKKDNIENNKKKKKDEIGNNNILNYYYNYYIDVVKDFNFIKIMNDIKEIFKVEQEILLLKDLHDVSKYI